MQFEKLQNFVLDRLATGLSPGITYHNAEHTKSVLAAVESVATLSFGVGAELKAVVTTEPDAPVGAVP